MADGQTNTVIRYIRQLMDADSDPSPAGQLLDRFVHHQDEAAFRTLVHRFGPVVWGVCRRVLRAEPDAEDAFQATFLVLVRKAKTISKGDLLGNWLYGVAYRIAIRAKANALKRLFHERQAEPMPAEDSKVDNTIRELGPVLDEEVQRLPAKYRVPFVLCYLEGKTNEEAARELRCPKGTVQSRLARAREKLRRRLSQRGITLSSGALALSLSTHAANATVPDATIDTTVKSGILIAGGRAPLGAVVSPSVAVLTQGALRKMFMTKLLMTTFIFLFGGLLGTGVGVLGYQKLGPQSENQTPKNAPKIAPAPAPELENERMVKLPSTYEGVILFIGAEAKEGEKIPQDRIFKFKLGDQMKTIRWLQKGDRVEEGQLLARLDDRLARNEEAVNAKKMSVAENDFKSAEKTQDVAYQRYLTQLNLKSSGGATSTEDLRAAQLLWNKSTYEAQAKKALYDLAKLDWEKTKTILEMHEIRSHVRGVVQTIHKNPGEAVKKWETVFTIRLSDK
ncbi:MAG TPA: sigma-70 family RNA polymerase sigma factor [Gemmataceae bacterium]|jgi:RNA polymerase sigma factor (sigma-70 family)|nr:sigma-70 family RNA polymerase sigma factor [Gemmataceae bacterium]